MWTSLGKFSLDSWVMKAYQKKKNNKNCENLLQRLWLFLPLKCDTPNVSQITIEKIEANNLIQGRIYALQILHKLFFGKQFSTRRAILLYESPVEKWFFAILQLRFLRTHKNSTIVHPDDTCYLSEIHVCHGSLSGKSSIAEKLLVFYLIDKQVTNIWYATSFLV